MQVFKCMCMFNRMSLVLSQSLSPASALAWKICNAILEDATLHFLSTINNFALFVTVNIIEEVE